MYLKANAYVNKELLRDRQTFGADRQDLSHILYQHHFKGGIVYVKFTRRNYFLDGNYARSC